MNLLFVTQLAGQMRHFTPVLRLLGERGHSVTILGANKSPGQPMRRPSFLNGLPNLELMQLPAAGSDTWTPYRRSIRYSANYLPYLHPKLAAGGPARERASSWVDPNLKHRLTEGGALSKSLTARLLRLLERTLPPDPNVIEHLSTNGYDAVVTTPLVFNQTVEQTDFVKAAHLLGIPVAFPVFSWDNLSTKGSISAMPDEVYVWNRTQKEEAIEVHSVPAEQVHVLGAWRFDEFAALAPSLSRAEFCSKVGFDAAQPIVLYLGSSPFIAPNEGPFVAEWLKQIRTSGLMPLSRANLFLRAHPRSQMEWRQFLGTSEHDRLHLQDMGTSKFDELQLLFDSLYHCAAVVGVNTSAMLEAAMLGVPVHSLRHPLTERAQREVIHFDYLHRGGDGLLHLADSAPEHLRLLNQCLTRPADRPDPRSLRFKAIFLDSPLAETSATEQLVDHIEQLARTHKSPRPATRSTRVFRFLARSMLASRLIRLQPDWAPEAPSAEDRGRQR